MDHGVCVRVCASSLQYKLSILKPVDYRRQEKRSVTDNSFLDPHHTYFIFVDSTDLGSEIDFRSQFESKHIYGIFH